MLRICSTSPDDIKALLQGTLHVREDTYPAFQAVLPHISPAISGHPFFPTVGALELPEASFRTIIRGETWLPGACQGTILDEMTLLKTQMTQVGARGLSQRPTGESRSVFRSIEVGMASRTVAAAKQRSRPQKNVSVEITDLLPRIGRPGKRTWLVVSAAHTHKNTFLQCKLFLINNSPNHMLIT